MIKVGVVGYGTIGKRVADAVLLQDDMELVGITANTYNYRIKTAYEKGIKIFPVNSLLNMVWSGIGVEGDFDDLVKQCDVVVDCMPKGIGQKNKDRYKYWGIKAIFQGGEKPNVGKSFVSQCNYDEVLGSDFIRVVSCNTTGLCRTLHAVDKRYGVESVHATIVRRAADPWDIYHGPINAIVPTLELPSHHGPDVQTVLPHIEIFTTSMTVPTTVMHMHSVTIDLKEEAVLYDMIELFDNTERVRIVKNTEGIRSTAEIIEYAKDLGHSRGDMPDICVWEETVGIAKNKLFYLQAIHQESNVIPENIDAIRAAMGKIGL
ncbi:type II glyceraldehyde-3-phosphate dehydrogenase [Candidatus Pacearchaeota archaeon]|nr:type II glyceraldehyde-3-phosphate dehydrogenase [Candidatus Pacearchaeota archaeon]